MPVLAGLFEKAGCTAVKTYIQSGNVVFTKAGSIDGVAEAVERAIVRAAGFESPVVIRSEAELRSLLEEAPFADPGGKKPALHALFLKHEPAAEAVQALDPGRSPGDRFEVRGSHVYLLCPNGLAETKLTNAYFDGKLRTTSTGRNFRTIQRMLEMCGE